MAERAATWLGTLAACTTWAVITLALVMSVLI